jgi:hypothetical protein
MSANAKRGIAHHENFRGSDFKVGHEERASGGLGCDIARFGRRWERGVGYVGMRSHRFDSNEQGGDRLLGRASDDQCGDGGFGNA